MTTGPKGDKVTWCPACDRYVHVPEDWTQDLLCPTCGCSIRGCRCNRCGSEWIPRRTRTPSTCPRCRSPYWNRARVR